MSEITLNDEKMEANPGERLLALARRKGAHMWFACDGRGMCRTCECHILKGADSLSPPSDIEKDMLSEERRKDGYRLACQTTIIGEGPLEVISQAEWIRRKTLGILLPESASQSFKNLETLSNGLLSAAKEFGQALPVVLWNIVPSIIEDPPTLESMQKYLGDAARMFQRVLSPKDTDPS